MATSGNNFQFLKKTRNVDILYKIIIAMATSY